MNYALVGAFVLGLGGLLIAGLLWLASGGALHKRHDLYLAIEEESVSGLNLNAPVKFFGVEVGKPQDRPWGMRDFTLFDPSGVLWRIAQNIAQNTSSKNEPKP